MKVSRIIINGIIIFIGIAAFFLIMEVSGLADNIYLRLVNFIFVIYGVNRTIKQDYKDGIDGYFTNLSSAFLTAFTSLILTIFAFIAYAEYRGGEAYLDTFVENYIFGGDPSLYQFCIGLFIEGLAACAIVSFALMQYWKDKVEKINKVDDAAHN
ncbi:hypothetical protein [Flavobacterium sp. MK4S-17]|jgi:hypothetical protein|uniref:hypothetical protein n=1 Tax=Flavobacterium sp. MK4S-17 TaxID=2543737 RepID=UPI001359C340|nr:hypothetical protein [Flavobacterium sp. MK4S-17]